MKTIFTIFAGRKVYLEILFTYLDRLLERGLLTEVHLWDYTREKSDEEYIEKICQEKEHYKLMKLKNPDKKGAWNWGEYYSYYSETAKYDDEDIIIKCDDDIVYIDLNKFEAFLSEVTDKGLYFPNIINNDACAYIQTQNGVHDFLKTVSLKRLELGADMPLTSWYMDHGAACRILKLFLEDKERFKLDIPNIKWGSRISINMFAGRFKTIKNYYEQFKYKGRRDDEAFLSGRVCKLNNQENTIVPFFNVAHFAFGPQNSKKLEEKFLSSFQQLAK